MTQYSSPHLLVSIEKGTLPTFLYDPRLTRWQNFGSESVSAALVKNIFYPLDVAQTLMQTNSPDAKEGVIPTLSHLYKTYGLTSWFRGNLAFNESIFFLAIGGFLGNTIKKSLKTDNRYVALLAELPVQLGLFALYPFQVAKVKMITNPTKYGDTIQTLKTVYQEEGARGLYNGSDFWLFETATNLATTYAGFEIAGLLFRKPTSELTATENIGFAILGTFLAALLHYPLDTAKNIVLSKSGYNEGGFKTLVDVGEKYGVMGLWKGFSANILKLPSLLVQRSINGMLHVYFLKKNGYRPPYLYPTVM